MASFFLCRLCGREVTDLLEELPEDELRLAVGEPTVPRGRFVRATRAWLYQEVATGNQPGHRYLGADGDEVAIASGDFVLDGRDVAHAILPGAKHGCCGWQPRGELNACCAAGHPIGTLHADSCWSVLLFRLSAGAVVESRL